MALIPGSVRLTGFIAPTDSTDVFPVTDPKWGLGGLRRVSGTTERDDITTERREAGMLVYSEFDDTYFKLGTGLTNSDWEPFLGGDGGNYLSISGGTVTGDTYFTANLSAGTIYSGSTDLYDIIYGITTGQTGNYIPLSGTGGNDITGDLEFDDDVALSWNSAQETIEYDSAEGTLSINTSDGVDFETGVIYSAGTDLYEIFGTSSLTGGTNITVTGDTINLNDDIVINSITATTMSAGTIYSGSTDLYDIFTQDVDLVWSAGTAVGAIQSKTGSTASGNFSLAFGLSSAASGNYSVSLGGSANTVSSSYSIIIGGQSNYLNTSSSNIIGSKSSYLGQASSHSTILGGLDLEILGSSSYASALGGRNLIINTISNYSSILGGKDNEISRSENSSVIGGENNNILGSNSVHKSNVLLGGSGNSLSEGIHSSILAGNHNTIEASEGSSDTFIVGGEFNMIMGGFNVGIIGGNLNSIDTQTNDSIIVGGDLNYIGNDVDRSVIIGGQSITASTSDTAYVPNLNINLTPDTDNALDNLLVRDSDGTVKTRTIGSIASGATFGSGTTGTIAIWSGTSTLGDSVITQTGTTVGIGGDVEAEKLTLNATTYAPLNLPVLPTSFTSSTHGDIWISSDSSTGTTLFKMVVSGVTKAVQIS